MFPITKSNSTNFWNSRQFYVPGSLITITIIGIGIKWLINQSSVGCLANSFNKNRIINNTPSDSEQVETIDKIYQLRIKRPPNKEITDFKGLVSELIDSTDAKCLFVINGKKYTGDQLRSDHAQILIGKDLIHIMSPSNNDNTSPLPTNSEASLLVRQPNNSDSSRYRSKHISTIRVLNPSNNQRHQLVVRFADNNTSELISARDCIELIQAIGIKIYAIPQHFQLISKGSLIRGDEDVSFIKSETLHCINLKPSANEMEVLFNFFSLSVSLIQTIDNAITSEYYRCVQGQNRELSAQLLKDYRECLVNGLSSFENSGSQNCDYNIDKIISYLDGLIQAIQDIENFNR